MFIICYIKRFLSVQEDFKVQKYKIKKSITNSANDKHNIVIYFPKYHFVLNLIEHFWCNAKKLASENCNYTLDDLRWHVSCSLANISNHTILAYFYRCRQKIDLSCEGIGYGSLQWKARTTHHKPTNNGDNRWVCWVLMGFICGVFVAQWSGFTIFS